jgi:hypothetical protein
MHEIEVRSVSAEEASDGVAEAALATASGRKES